MEIEAALFEKYGTITEVIDATGMTAIQEEEERNRETEQREINEASEAIKHQVLPP